MTITVTATRTQRALMEARELIADPECWTRGSIARDADDNPVHVFSPYAVKWCGLGALYRTVGEHNDLLAVRVATTLAEAAGESISGLNDRAGREAILDAYDRAIAAEAERWN